MIGGLHGRQIPGRFSFPSEIILKSSQLKKPGNISVRVKFKYTTYIFFPVISTAKWCSYNHPEYRSTMSTTSTGVPRVPRVPGVPGVPGVPVPGVPQVQEYQEYHEYMSTRRTTSTTSTGVPRVPRVQEYHEYGSTTRHQQSQRCYLHL